MATKSQSVSSLHEHVAAGLDTVLPGITRHLPIKVAGGQVVQAAPPGGVIQHWGIKPRLAGTDTYLPGVVPWPLIGILSHRRRRAWDRQTQQQSAAYTREEDSDREKSRSHPTAHMAGGALAMPDLLDNPVLHAANGAHMLKCCCWKSTCKREVFIW